MPLGIHILTFFKTAKHQSLSNITDNIQTILRDEEQENIHVLSSPTSTRDEQ